MKKPAVRTLFVLLIPILSGPLCPVMAQHRGAARGQAPNRPGQHPANGGMPHVPAHIQQQMQEQQRRYQQQVAQHQQQMAKESARQQQVAQKQYEGQVNQFHEWLNANGGGSHRETINSLKTPAEFDRWANTQKQRKAQKKSYDPLYDHFRSFADSMNPRGAGTRKGKAESASQARSAKDRNETTSRQAEAARKEADRAKRDAVQRAENAKRDRAEGKHQLAQDQASVNLLRTAHTKLQEADHDYQGNRVRALHHVHQALQHLGSSAPMGVGSSVSLGNMPQAQSDGILRDSLQKLRTAESQLGSRSNAAAHHLAHGLPSARPSVSSRPP